MDQTNVNAIFSIPGCVFKSPRTLFSSQGCDSRSAYQVIIPKDSNLEFLTREDLWRQSPLPDASNANQSTALRLPHSSCSPNHHDHADLPEPKWLHRFQELPQIYREILMATTRSYGLDTNMICQIFLSSGLDLRVLQHIWFLVNQSHPGWLTPSELVLALALIALAQRDQFYLHQPIESIISTLSTGQVFECSEPPIPNVVLPCSGAAPSYSNSTQLFGGTNTAMSPFRVHSLSHSISNGLPSLENSTVLSTMPTTTSAGPPANEEDWADFTSCEKPDFGPPPSSSSFHPEISHTNPLTSTKGVTKFLDRRPSHVASHEDDFGEFQASGDIKSSQTTSSSHLLITRSNEEARLQSVNGVLPNYNLSADFESYQSPREILQNEWMRCLRQCSNVFCESLEALTSLESTADMEEFIEQSEVHDFFLDLFEVHRIVQRIQWSATNYGLLNPELQSQFAKLKSDFHKHWDYLARSDLAAIWESSVSNPIPGTIHTPNPSSTFSICGVCLIAFERDESVSSDRVVALAGCQYHLPCANFWINRVQLSLPALKPP